GSLFTNSQTVSLQWQAFDNTSGTSAYLLTEEPNFPSLSDNWTQHFSESLDNLSFALSSQQDGTKTIFLFLRDNAGNIAQQSAAITLDRQAPTLAWDQAAPTYLTQDNLSLAFLLSDNLSSQLYYLLLDNSSEPPLLTDDEWNQYTSENLTLSLDNLSEGLFTRFLWLKDQAGNLAGPETIQTLIDRTAPSITNFHIDNGSLFTNSQTVSLQWQAFDNTSKVASFAILEDKQYPSETDWLSYAQATENYAYTLKNSTDGIKSLTLFVRDHAQLQAQREDNITLDSTGPEITLTHLPPTYLNYDNFSLGFLGQDILSTVSDYQILEDNQTPAINSGWLSYT
ncbi:MAG: hypothetical protein EBR97_03590, partial [Firmicutes bacterium]|nr:hypothetical protein [Bacillota bacterium]